MSQQHDSFFFFPTEFDSRSYASSVFTRGKNVAGDGAIFGMPRRSPSFCKLGAREYSEAKKRVINDCHRSLPLRRGSFISLLILR